MYLPQASIWRFPEIGGIAKASIFVGFSIQNQDNQAFWGSSIYGTFMDLGMCWKSVLGRIQALEIGCGWGRAKPQRLRIGEVSHPTKPYMEPPKKMTRSGIKPGFLLFLENGSGSEISRLGLSNYLASKGAKVTGDGCRAQVAGARPSDGSGLESTQSRWQELFNCLHSWAPLRVWKANRQ